MKNCDYTVETQNDVVENVSEVIRRRIVVAQKCGNSVGLIEIRRSAMTNRIGESAGAAWKYLTEHSEAAPGEIKKALKLNDDVLYMAIGWLAREDKLVFKDSGKRMQISLSSH
jgi:hypothetical protein